MYNFRTDMAVERRDLYKKANNIENDIDGIETEEEKVDEDITISRVNITNENGEFKSSREYRSAKEDFVNLDEVIIEIEAQYHQFIKLTGRKPQ